MRAGARWSFVWVLWAGLCVAGWACGDDGGRAEDTQTNMDTGDVSLIDVSPDIVDVSDTTDSSDAGDSSNMVDSADTTADTHLPLPELVTVDPSGGTPTDLLQGSGLESCAIYEQTRCVAGESQACALYDPASSAWVTAVDPLLDRVLMFDRWYDLYHQPAGLTAERVFNAAMPAGTPESTWGSLQAFARYDGAGDAVIWNGAALVSYAMRYLETGTEADYQRVEGKVRAMLTQFEVTGIPGYLARYHYLHVDPAAPPTDRIITEPSGGVYDHRRQPFDASTVADMPPEYTDGFVDQNGTTWTGETWWSGNPSIDQYTGVRIGFPLVYDLIRDDELKARMATHLVCYLNRLERIEIINLQRNPDAREAVASFFAQGNPVLDPDDIDFASIDTVVAYVLRQPNAANAETFDRTCPSTVQMTPTEVLDASSSGFLFDMFRLVTELDGRSKEAATNVDHIYVPSIRGGDALHMMHLAAIAYHFTGDDAYRRFLFEELIGAQRALEVAHTAGAFNMPRFCRAFFGHHIGFSPTWAFVQLLAASELEAAVQDVIEVEMWQKEMVDQRNAKFNIMYAGELPPSVATARDTAIAEALTALDALGGNGGVLRDPKRTYSIAEQTVIDAMGASNSLMCPTAAERATCEDGFDILGVNIPGEPITAACTGAPTDCTMSDGLCAKGQAQLGLPMGLRQYADFAWQRNPFAIGQTHSVEGYKQSPGLDLTEEYWLARHYGFVTEGAGQALAWKPTGTSCL